MSNTHAGDLVIYMYIIIINCTTTYMFVPSEFARWLWVWLIILVWNCFWLTHITTSFKKIESHCVEKRTNITNHFLVEKLTKKESHANIVISFCIDKKILKRQRCVCHRLLLSFQ